MNYAEMFSMNCEKNVPYTRLKLLVHLLIAPKLWQNSRPAFYGR